MMAEPHAQLQRGISPSKITLMIWILSH